MWKSSLFIAQCLLFWTASGIEEDNHVPRKRVNRNDAARHGFESKWKDASNQVEKELRLEFLKTERFLQTVTDMSVPIPAPTRRPTRAPNTPTRVPTPTVSPVPTVEVEPTRQPTRNPTIPSPTRLPTPTRFPSPSAPSRGPTLPTTQPIPTRPPTRAPTDAPAIPSESPTLSQEPTSPTVSLSPSTSESPSLQPSVSDAPTDETGPPTRAPRTRPPTQPPTRGAPTTPSPVVSLPPSPPCPDDNQDDFLLDLLSEVTDPSLLLDMSTPQGMAYFFLLDEVPSYVCSPTIVQRYSLSVFYFSTEGSRWTEDSGWLSRRQECEWFGVECNINGLVTSLNLGKQLLL